MTDDEIRIAVAEACGYYFTGSEHDPEACWRRDFKFVSVLPDYCSDLNAMHEAEGTLRGIQRVIYWEEKLPIMTNAGMTTSSSWNRYGHATARQRAESFLRALGKWKDTPLSSSDPDSTKTKNTRKDS